MFIEQAMLIPVLSLFYIVWLLPCIRIDILVDSIDYIWVCPFDNENKYTLHLIMQMCKNSNSYEKNNYHDRLHVTLLDVRFTPVILIRFMYVTTQQLLISTLGLVEKQIYLFNCFFF